MINLIVQKTMLAELELAKNNIDRPRKEMKLYLPKKIAAEYIAIFASTCNENRGACNERIGNEDTMT